MSRRKPRRTKKPGLHWETRALTAFGRTLRLLCVNLRHIAVTACLCFTVVMLVFGSEFTFSREKAKETATQWQKGIELVNKAKDVIDAVR